ncbi:hypothetical protein E0H26_10880 [Micromonospora zingiberis]|uniref:Uncharacterized protein n=1 Tax=Micromonospora zingiberis TaxID=2053011 RepID=A0A4R0GMF9_9ACTN|nr:hypothetical protein [Micromonospora zingiberis]TCB98077.1 hypothetical protein E0H26_10880 [Micromonospora zingiberis]
MLLGIGFAAYWFWYEDAEITRSVVQSVAAWIVVPTVLACGLLFLVGRGMSTVLYRFAALVAILLAGCATVMGDHRVLIVQTSVQVAFALLISKPPESAAS